MRSWTKLKYRITQKIMNFPLISSVYQGILKWSKQKSLLPKRPNYELEEDFRLYNTMLKHGLSSAEISSIFNLDNNDLIHKFEPLTKRYQTLNNTISEVKINEFIIGKKDHDRDIKTNIISIITYPLLLIFILFSLIIIFKIMIIPSLFEAMTMFDADSNDLKYIKFFMDICLWSIVLISILAIILFSRFQKDRFKIYQMINHYQRSNIIKEYITLQFCVYLNILLSEGIPTRSIFRLLNQLHDDKVISTIAGKAIIRLENGEDIIDVLESTDLNERFIKIFKTGIVTGSLAELLQRYYELEKIIFLNKLKKKIRFIQYLIYLFIGTMVIILYQMLLLPLNTINQL